MSRNVAPKNPRQVENTLRLSVNELLPLLDELDARSGQDEEAALKRAFARGRYRAIGVPVVFNNAGQSGAPLYLVPRNLSASGIGLIHSTFVHTGTPCTVTLPTVAQRAVRIPGVVVRSCHLTGTVHEVGVKFDQIINPREFLNVRPMSGWYSAEQVTANELHGVVLHVDSSENQRDAFRSALDGSQIVFKAARSADDAMEQLGPEVDAVVIANRIEGTSGFEALESFADAGLERPVILAGEPGDPAAHTTASHRLVRTFCPTPFAPETTVRAIADALAPTIWSNGRVPITLPATEPQAAPPAEPGEPEAESPEISEALEADESSEDAPPSADAA